MLYIIWYRQIIAGTNKAMTEQAGLKKTQTYRSAKQFSIPNREQL